MRDISELKSSQIPALQLLAKLGYQVLSPSEAFAERGHRINNVLLEDILREQLKKINRIHYKGEAYLFSEENIQAAIQKLKNLEYEGQLATNEAVYDLLTLPVSLTQKIEGNTRSFDLNYIDWKDINNNVFHAVPEYEVEDSQSNEAARPDIVLFVNGIPVCVIECKSPDVKDGIKEAISQHIRNQGADYIPQLFAYAQLLLATNKNTVKYATAGTPEKFWSVWNEQEDIDDDIQALVNKSLSTEQKDALFSGEYKKQREFFDHQGERLLTEQDKAIYSLCRPERLLDLTYRFIVFECKQKKIARYQQFFVVRNALKRIKQRSDKKREGGIIWQTQGSGKSLTMVMLVRALVLDAEISNPRILLVTDRTDLDDQLGNTFKACGLKKERATSGRNLIKHLKEKKDIVTTLIHKFDKALTAEKYIDESANIFALVDESHRTNFAFFAARMRLMLPNACYIGFTGTPLLREEKNSFYKFGRLIEPCYPIEQAVEDKAIVPLLYEGRLVDVQQNKKSIDWWFEKHTEDLTDEQKADLKQKYAHANILNQSDQVIYRRAFDISEHFRKNWQGKGFKGQLVAPRKLSALKYHQYLKEIGYVSSEVVISPPDLRKGYQGVDEDSSDEIVRFWKAMMSQYGSAEKYEEQIIERFKHSDGEPEILIVVDKLLTGFDAPRNTVLYLCKQLKEHTLLQAIARVNRLHEGKDFGYILDYDSVLEKLDEALTMYDDFMSRAFKGFDEEDIAKALISVNEEVDKLPQHYSVLWDIFKEIKNKNDDEAFEVLLADKEKRHEFYECLKEYSNTLGVALSTDKFLGETSDEDLNRYKSELKNFMKLRQSVQFRYAEKIDFGPYEKGIKRLLNTHIQADEVIHLNEPVNILDEQSVKGVMEESSTYGPSVRSDAARADAIAHATKKTIKEKWDEDPALYEKFSKLIQDAIDDYKNKRISATEYLDKTTNYQKAVASNSRDDVPSNIQENGEACAYYGVIKPYFEEHVYQSHAEKIAAETSLFVQKALQEKGKVDFWRDDDAQKSVINDIDDYLHDKVKAEFEIPLSDKQMDEILEKVMNIARSRSERQ